MVKLSLHDGLGNELDYPGYERQEITERHLVSVDERSDGRCAFETETIWFGKCQHFVVQLACACCLWSEGERLRMFPLHQPVTVTAGTAPGVAILASDIEEVTW